ncbi:MAG TPA: hypothetical protein VIK72_16580 [Clostridiaceae bacterium]
MESDIYNKLRSRSLSVKEKKEIEKVILEYDIKVLDICYISGYYIIKDAEGKTFKLSRIKHGLDKTKASFIISDKLMTAGFNNFICYYKTKKDKLFVKSKETLYFVTNYKENKAIDYNSEDFEKIFSLVARFHYLSTIIMKENIRIKDKSTNWYVEFDKRFKMLLYIKKIVNNKRNLDAFDELYINTLDSARAFGLKAIELLQDSDLVLKDSVKVIELSTSCFKRICKSDEYFIDGIEKLRKNYKLWDIARIIRKTMFISNFHWDFLYAKTFLEAYSLENKLSKDELKIILAFIIFPKDFWKLGYNKYIKHVEIEENNYIHKLNKIVKYLVEEEAFINNFSQYILDKD